MEEVKRLKYIRTAMRVIGALFIFGVHPLTVLWPPGWAWHVGRSEYLEMIIAIYATLGIFLLLAARNPQQHLSLISFTIWSSLVHGATMAIQALANPQHSGHLFGDVPAPFVIAAVLGWLSTSALTLKFARDTNLRPAKKRAGIELRECT